MVQVRQSLLACIALSAVGGVVEVLATAILAYQDDQKKEGHPWPRWAKICALSSNIILQITASTIGNLLAPWFGPVAIVGPMFLSSQLVANMVVFGFVLGLEYFSKEMKVGTYIIVVSAVLLPGVGPAPQDGQDITALLMNWYSLLWSAILVTAMFVSSGLLNILDVTKITEGRRVSLLLVARCSAFATNLTTSRVMVLNPSVGALAGSIVLKVLSGAVMTHAIIVQSTSVLQARFVPLNASALILVNALTGLIIWEDWRAVGSWTGYACVFVLLFLGNYLLLGEIELFVADSPHYGTPGTLQRFRRLRRRASTEEESETGLSMEKEVGQEKRGGDSSLDEEVNGGSDRSASEDESSQRSNGFKDGEGPLQDNVETQAAAARRKQAWSSVYGLNDTVHQGGGKYREHNVFAIDRCNSV